MAVKKYIISIKLVECGPVGLDKYTMAEHGVFRTFSKGEAQLQFDSIVGILKQEGISFDNDPLSKVKP